MMKYVSLLFLVSCLHSVSYEHYLDENISAHILTIDPEEDIIRIVNCDGVETPSHIAKLHGAVAAINGGFYRGGENLGAPSGILQIDGVRLSSTDRCRGAIGWNGNGEDPRIDKSLHVLTRNLPSLVPTHILDQTFHELHGPFPPLYSDVVLQSDPLRGHETPPRLLLVLLGQHDLELLGVGVNAPRALIDVHARE